MSEPEKLDLRSMDITKEQKEKLRQLFPEIFTEDKIDFEKLKLTLGESIEAGKERYGMNWPGKADCFKIIQNPSIGTLKPCPEESVNFDKTQNLFIEGDNLEVLKLLQKSYYGKVKMIYIDPPYNTGNDFIYPDDYTENLTTYLQYTSQVDVEGKKFSTNADTEGRFHTKWLNMMYPRIFLAKNLLSDDGVILMSIDDNEVTNLKKMCDEIFGEENFLAQLVWKKKYTGGKHAKHYVDMHEYILVYSKNKDDISGVLIDRPEQEKDKFTEVDDYLKERGRYYIRPLKSNLAERPTLVYPIKMPDGKEITTQWLVSKDTFEKLMKEERVEFRRKRDGSYQIYKKYYEKDGEGKVKVPSLIESFPNTEAKYELKDLFDIKEGRDNIFYTVKPKELIKYIIKPYCGNDGDIILDFFAGTCTTAHAVFEMVRELDMDLKFICVQLPEIADENSSASKMGFSNVSEIGKERIRKVIKNIEKEKGETLFKDKQLDLGFKVFKLDKSNFKIWDTEKISADKQAIEKQLELHIDHIDPKAMQEDILFEILLKAGFELTTKTEKIELAGKTVYSVEDGAMLVCLEKELTKEVIKAMAEKQPSRVICLDQGFANNDQLKTNAVQIMKTKGVDDFRTV